MGKNWRFYLHRDGWAVEVGFYLHRDGWAVEVGFYLHRDGWAVEVGFYLLLYTEIFIFDGGDLKKMMGAMLMKLSILKE